MQKHTNISKSDITQKQTLILAHTLNPHSHAYTHKTEPQRIKQLQCMDFGIGPMIRWINYEETHSKIGLCRDKIGRSSIHVALFSLLLGQSYYQIQIHTYTNLIHPTYLNTALFPCHVDFLLHLTLKLGHHFYSTACIAASMTKPLPGQQRCVSVERKQSFE